MLDMHYLHSHNGCAVKKFVLRSKNQIEVDLGTVKDRLYVSGGVLIYERKLSNTAVFCIVSFEDDIMLATWESIVCSALSEAKIVEILCSKVLIVKDDEGNDDTALAKTESIKATINKYEAAVLRERKIKDAEYELLLFFTNEGKMAEWEQASFK